MLVCGFCFAFYDRWWRPGVKSTLMVDPADLIQSPKMRSERWRGAGSGRLLGAGRVAGGGRRFGEKIFLEQKICLVSKRWGIYGVPFVSPTNFTPTTSIL